MIQMEYVCTQKTSPPPSNLPHPPCHPNLRASSTTEASVLNTADRWQRPSSTHSNLKEVHYITIIITKYANAVLRGNLE